MKARRFHPLALPIAGAIGVTLLTLSIVLFVVCREPVLQGRPTTAWIRDLSHGDKAVQSAAGQLFKNESRKAVPGLLSAIDQRRSLVASWIGRLPFRDQLPRRIREWVQDRTTLRELDRVWAIRMCAMIGPDARDSHPTLRRAMTDRSAFVRGAAARALAQTQAPPSTTLPLLEALLSDPEPGARAQAALAMGMYRPPPGPLLAKLHHLTNDPDPSVEFSAQLAIALVEKPERVITRTNEIGDITFRIQR